MAHDERNCLDRSGDCLQPWDRNIATARVRCLDHVVPAVRRGSNSYRNLASACAECNSQKGETAAEGFLRLLYRDGRLTASELTGRLRAVEALAAGKLRPALHSEDAKDD